jgi:hypothetical protein
MYKDCIPGMFGSSPYVAIQQTYLLMVLLWFFFLLWSDEADAFKAENNHLEFVSAVCG